MEVYKDSHPRMMDDFSGPDTWVESIALSGLQASRLMLRGLGDSSFRGTCSKSAKQCGREVAIAAKAGSKHFTGEFQILRIGGRILQFIFLASSRRTWAMQE